MTKTVVLKDYITFRGILKSNLKFIVICLGFIISLIAGTFAISVCNDDNYFGLSSYFSEYLGFLNNCGFLEVFLNSLYAFSVLILINMVLGLCVIGAFFNWFVLFILGFGIGSVSGYIFSVYSLKGLCFFLLIILPGLFLFSLDYILSFQDSFDFSLMLFRTVSKKMQYSANLRQYFIKYLIYFVLVIFISLFNSFMISTFFGFFNF